MSSLQNPNTVKRPFNVSFKSSGFEHEAEGNMKVILLSCNHKLNAK